MKGLVRLMERKAFRSLGKFQIRKFVYFVKDVMNKRVTLPVWALILLVLGCLYVISPLDTLPDFVPLLGFLDDALMTMFILNKIKPHAKFTSAPSTPIVKKPEQFVLDRKKVNA